jgi:5-methylcytosine-specific restriction endonuclease McrA
VTRFYHRKQWRETSARYLRSHPFCEEPGCIARSTETDHRKSRSQGGSDAWDNLVAYCKPHHSAKTMRDRILKISKRHPVTTFGTQPQKTARFATEKRAANG